MANLVSPAVFLSRLWTTGEPLPESQTWVLWTVLHKNLEHLLVCVMNSVNSHHIKTPNYTSHCLQKWLSVGVGGETWNRGSAAEQAVGAWMPHPHISKMIQISFRGGTALFQHPSPGHEKDVNRYQKNATEGWPPKLLTTFGKAREEPHCVAYFFILKLIQVHMSHISRYVFIFLKTCSR